MTNKAYHEIFIPLPDVYELSGKSIFQHLERNRNNEKNLVVVPLPFLTKLDEMKTHSNGGSDEVLKFLVKAIQKGQILDSDKNKEGMRIYKLYEGLDAAFLDKPIVDENNFSNTSLEQNVTKFWERSEKSRPVLITNRESHHIKFSTRGIKVEAPSFLMVNEDIVNEGIIMGNEKIRELLYQNRGKIPVEKAVEILRRDLYLNQFVRFMGDKVVYARVTGKLVMSKSGSRVAGAKDMTVQLLAEKEYERKINIRDHPKEEILGITPCDMEQYIAMQYGLLNPHVSLFFLCGSQGSGKTLLSYVCAIDQILWRGKNKQKKEGRFKKIIALKPTEILGGKRRDVGALPGNLYSKIKPHLGSYIDAHRESIMGTMFAFEEMLKHPTFINDYGAKRNPDANKKIEGNGSLPENTEVIEMTYSGFMRGRSLKDTLMLIDEGQNFSPYELKTIIQRMGEGSKCIIMGDPAQVDNPFCSRKINGLTSAIQHYLPRDYVALVNLARNYRHQMSEDSTSWQVYSG